MILDEMCQRDALYQSNDLQQIQYMGLFLKVESCILSPVTNLGVLHKVQPGQTFGVEGEYLLYCFSFTYINSQLCTVPTLLRAMVHHKSDAWMHAE